MDKGKETCGCSTLQVELYRASSRCHDLNTQSLHSLIHQDAHVHKPNLWIWKMRTDGIILLELRFIAGTHSCILLMTQCECSEST